MLLIFKFDNTNVIEEIEKFEEKYKLKIPTQHKVFLMKYNGGGTPDTGFKINKISSDVRAFYGFGNGIYDYKDDDFLRDYIELMYLPVAVDSFGNVVVEGIRGENENKIFFFDHEDSSYAYLAENFEAFVKKIKSEKFIMPTIEERIQGMKESESTIEVDDELIEIWQEEIDEYKGQVQEKVIL